MGDCECTAQHAHAAAAALARSLVPCRSNRLSHAAGCRCDPDPSERERSSRACSLSAVTRPPMVQSNRDAPTDRAWHRYAGTYWAGQSCCTAAGPWTYCSYRSGVRSRGHVCRFGTHLAAQARPEQVTKEVHVLTRSTCQWRLVLTARHLLFSEQDNSDSTAHNKQHKQHDAATRVIMTGTTEPPTTPLAETSAAAWGWDPVRRGSAASGATAMSSASASSATCSPSTGFASSSLPSTWGWDRVPSGGVSAVLLQASRS